MERRDALVEEIRNGGRLSARQLAFRLGVSKSTILRDVAKLQEAGVPIRLGRAGYALDGPEAVRREIDRALLDRRVLRIEYRGPDGASTSRDVEPSICLGGRGGRWYLVAWCRLRDDVRVFRLDRIVSAAITDERHPEPEQGPLEMLAGIAEG
ncbi:helix-turn-helix transcriptional regulator [Sphaerimonospora cavernae]|uniref:Helix-turn-helix transcriptional regulator n=1 Tax=Sphaerimonospora cavernae TaxID=1740611 RepID=A0ABV6TZ86_9ACTN